MLTLTTTPVSTQERDGRAFDEVSDAVDGMNVQKLKPAEPLQGVTATVPTQDLPPMTVEDQDASTVVQYHTFDTAQEDSVCAANALESRQYVQRMTDGWNEDAKGVLIFIGIFSAIVSSFIIESYKMLSPNSQDQGSLQPSPPPAAAVITFNIMWLISLVLNIIAALFATLALQWTRRYALLPQVWRSPRDHMNNRSSLFLGTLTFDMDHAIVTTIMLVHLSVFLFLAGLVIFFFMINKIVATVVSIIVGLFGAVYFTLTILACIDRSFPYHTPLSDVWWSQRERLGHT